LPVHPDVLIVAGSDDELARQLYEALGRRGRHCAFLDGPSAARLFTIRVAKSGVQVSPDIPLFVRESAWPRNKGVSDDERFLRWEAYATFWAAAALCKSPVINRPARRASRFTMSTVASRMGLRSASAYRELYVSKPASALGRLDPPIWGEDIDFHAKEISALRPNVPARLRTVDVDARYEIVSVVGARAFTATDDPRTRRDGLAARGVEIAARLGLHFASVTWTVNAGAARPVRVSGEPSMADLRACQQEVLDGLSEDLLL
jgi:hypothetical protein